MKKILYCFLLFVASVFASCSKDDGLPAPVVSNFSVTWNSGAGSDVVVGSVVTYTVQCENVEIVRYEWWVNGTVNSEANGPTFALTPAQRGEYSVKVVLYNADGGATTQEFMTLTVKDPAPAVTILCGDTQLENGGSIDVEVSEGTLPVVLNTGDVEISEYKWTLNGTALENQTKEYTLDLTHSGTNAFEVEVINRDQLSTTVSFTIRVNGPFKAGLWFYGTTTEGIAFFNPAQHLFYEDHLYQELNGEAIGAGGLNDLSICNGKIYLLTPTSESSWAQIVECDAQTLRKERVITAEGFNTGSLGEIAAMALLLGFLYMLCRKVITWHIPVAVLGSMFLFGGITWLIDPMHYMNPVFHLLTGGAILGAVFMATDYVTSPMSRKGMIVYGVGIGVITMLIRLWGSYPEGMSFAILIMNAVVPLINKYMKPKRFGVSPA